MKPMRYFVAVVITWVLVSACANPAAGAPAAVPTTSSSSELSPPSPASATGLATVPALTPTPRYGDPSPISSAAPPLITGSGPLGYAVGFGWDGVSGRMLVSATIHDFRFDPQSWELTDAGWTKVTAPPVATSPTIVGTLAFDSGRRREVLVAITNLAPETWEWDGTQWLSAKTEHTPSARSQNATGAYSPELREMVMVDQGDMPPSPNPTWLYDGSDWRSLPTSHSPPIPLHIEYDATRHSIVALSLADYSSWLFDGRDWTPIAQQGVAPGGVSRQAPSVALDQRTGEWVLFGGFDGMNANTETWTGDGSAWTRRVPPATPTPRVSVPGLDNLAWDAAKHRLLLFGGQAANGGAYLGDTWAWDGSSWTQLGG